MTKRKPKSVTVRITQLDIREGVPGEPRECAVARAMTRALGKTVSVDEALWRFAGEFAYHPLPARVQKFIARFDHHAKVEPMTFRITRL